MPDWNKSMQQTFEYYIVDPATWEDKTLLDKVKSSTIDIDEDSETLGSATIDITDTIDECYVRIYLVTIQNGIREKFPLATRLVQTPSISFDGKVQSISLDAYTPLLELKEKIPPVGYTTMLGSNIMDEAYKLCRENLRAPVVPAKSSELIYSDFVSNTNDTWMSYLSDLISNAKFKFSLDEYGRVLFAPNQDIAALQPIYTYDDSNSSILLPDIDLERDLYGIPNVVEVVYSGNTGYIYSVAENTDTSSPISIPNRGRRIVHRETDPDLVGYPTQELLDDYAQRLLKSLSSLEYTISYTHGYCPVRVGDCVLINYERSGFTNIKAKVVSQSITCEPGCPVSEKAIFTEKLWR